VNVLAWILQVVLALAFLAAGAMKISTPKEKLRERMAWVEGFQPNQIKGIGAVEVLGALGLILPAVTKIAPILTPLAALGLFLTMVGAVLTHIRLKEPVSQFAPALVLGVLSLIVAVIRFGPAKL
jgi:uncharacterized membrane protein YphA (DoxX/SURF4 family)